MTFGNWQAPEENPLDKLSRDELLTKHMKLKDQIEALKKEELDLRKYIVKRAFPNATEGTNTQELGNGYELKAKVKYNYNLKDNETVWAGIQELKKFATDGIGEPNQDIIKLADNLVSWKASFLLTEYRKWEELAEAGSNLAQPVLFIISKFMTRTEATPELEIKEPKGKKK